MSTRPPSRPPRLPGYEYEQPLGSGGFADVFLYRQFRPQRRVAIKVLLSNVLDESVRRLFDAVGHPVIRLVRTQMGPIRLNNQKQGSIRALGHQEAGHLLASAGM